MIKKILLYLSTLWIFASTALAVPFAQDYLGAAGSKEFQKEILANHDISQGAGMFANTFGDAFPIAKALALKKVPFLRIQLVWSDSHTYGDKEFKLAVSEAKRFCPLSSLTKLFLSGACEHRLNAQQAANLANAIKAACPSAEVVNVPLPQGAIVPGILNETHGGGKPRTPDCGFSFDGTAAEDADTETVKANFGACKYLFIWGPRYNGRWASNDPTPRPQRKGYADKDYIKSLIYLTTNKGLTSLDKSDLWKAISENKGNGDPRAGKPVAIVRSKSSSLTLKKNNQAIATLSFYGSYQDGKSYRYYAKEFGYQLGKKCGGVCDLYSGSKKLGSINPGFRENQYRN